MTIKSITPFLWFNTEAEDAANFYVSLFPNSRITHVSRYGDAGPGPKGSVMVVGFELNGQPLHRDQWRAHLQAERSLLAAGGLHRAGRDRPAVGRRSAKAAPTMSAAGPKDRFGLSWQINYAGLPDLMTGASGQQGDGGDDADEEDRHPGAEGRRRLMGEGAEA